MTRNQKRLIFHVDVNSAFLSWTAVKLVQEGGEDLRLIPSCVGGDPAKRTSIVTAKSIPAKKYGVRTGEPVSMALRKCPGLVIVRPDFKLYERYSHAFMDVCREYAPVVEKFSIDECFLDMTGTQLLYPDPVATAHEIKDKIRDTLGFTVNIGIGPNKLLAKMAGDFEKPDKVHTLFYEEIPRKLWPLPVGELIGVGQSTVRTLNKASVQTIGQLAACDVRFLQSLTGKKLGQQLHDMANGVDDSPVAREAAEAKGYSVSTTLEENVVTVDQAHKILLELADSVTARMRADQVKAGCVAVTIRSTQFQNRSHQRRLPQPTDITSEVFGAAEELFLELWDKKTPLRLLGISLTHLDHGEMVQLSMFEDERRERQKQLDRTIDALRGRFGADIIRRGSVLDSTAGVGKKYKAHLENQRDEREKDR